MSEYLCKAMALQKAKNTWKKNEEKFGGTENESVLLKLEQVNLLGAWGKFIFLYNIATHEYIKRIVTKKKMKKSTVIQSYQETLTLHWHQGLDLSDRKATKKQQP